MDIRQGLTNSVYRGVARLTGRVLGASRLVESVFVHRSVAAGEISFGKSDIDLVLVVRQPAPASADGPELASLYENVRRIRRFNPAIGHMAVQDPSGIRKAVEADTYLGSLDRRSSLLLYGKPVHFPEMAVRKEDALRRFAFWQDSFLSTAIRHGDARNLRKIASDMWNAYAVASGMLAIPFTTRSQAESHWSAHENSHSSEEVRSNPERSPFHGFRLAMRLHGELLPALKPMSDPMVFRARMAPRFRERLMVVVPGPDSPVPAEALERGSFLTTPELLHLYVHYVNPFCHWILPRELTELGLQPPTPEEFARACLFYGHSHTTRNPGFMHQDTTAPHTTVALLEHALAHLRIGEIPPPMPPGEVDELHRRRTSVEDYFRRDFGGLYHRTEELWAQLQELGTRTPIIRLRQAPSAKPGIRLTADHSIPLVR